MTMTERERVTPKVAGVIYKAVSPSGKVYIGQTINFPERKRKHKLSAFNKKCDSYSCSFYNSIRKYGFDNFTWEIIERDVLRENLNNREKYWISKYDSHNKGYNSTLGGDDNPVNYAEIRQKISNTLKGKLTGKDNPFYGRKHSEETKEKMRKNSGRKNNAPWNKGLTAEDNNIIRQYSQKLKVSKRKYVNKVVVLTAGKGSRLGDRTAYFNKCLLRVGNKAIISHIVDEFNEATEFVIVLGYKGDIVRQYLRIMHPKNKFTFVETSNYGKGYGPGYSLLQAKNFLQEPFVFASCDTIIDWHNATNWDGSKNKFTKYDLTHEQKQNWIVAAPIADEEKCKYCTVSFVRNKVSSYYDKLSTGTNIAFCGICYVHDYKIFWSLLEKTKKTNEEIQVVHAILGLPKVHVFRTVWFDTGSDEGLHAAREEYKGIQNLDKLDEELYVTDDAYDASVVKYFHNENMVKNRMERAKYLGDTIPNIQCFTKNFYRYDFADGVDLFKLRYPGVYLKDLLEYAKENLWIEKELDEYESLIFKDVCKKFYYDKTISRIHKLYDKIGIKDHVEIINGTTVPRIKSAFKRLNIDYLSDSKPSGFHGDFNFSNIVLSEGGFKFLDWRQDFGGIIEYGDKYYDFAKMYHSFLFPHPSVKDNKFYVKKSITQIKTFIEVPIEIERCKDIFEEWIISNGYDLWKVRVLTAMVLLNMSPLHESPIDEYLYYYARYYLQKVLTE